MSGLEGVIVTTLTPHVDHRGAFTEAFRASWPTGIAPQQWNFVSSAANVMRGFHVHVTHADYLLVAAGSLLLGMRDMRPSSASFGRTEMLRLDAASAAVTIPPGVAHGFYFTEPSIHFYSVSHYWNTADELGCRWDDPEIGLAWPTKSPLLSQRDREAGGFAQMTRAYAAALSQQGQQ